MIYDNNFIFDKYGQLIADKENAIEAANMLKKHGAVAVPLSLGNITMFHVSFVLLYRFIPYDAIYSDGSARGLQINIDRKGSYGFPIDSVIHPGSLHKLDVNPLSSDAEILCDFINVVLKRLRNEE